MAQIDMKNVTLRIQDGTGTPKYIDVKVGEGNFTFDEKKTREYIKDRGLLDLVRDGDEEPIDISFDFVWDYITTESGQTITVEDALKGVGGAATDGWVTSDQNDTCQPYSVDLRILNDHNCVDEFEEGLVFAKFRYEQLSHDLRNGTIACTGRCNITVAVATRIDEVV